MKRLALRILRGADGVWVGQLAFELNDGRRKGYEARVDENAIREDLARQYVPEGAVSGSIFSKLGRWIKKTARKVARWKVWKVLGKVVKAIVHNPITAAIVGVASTFFPPIGATYRQAVAALTVADKVAKGVGSAVKGLATVAEAAAKSPVAAQAIESIKAAEKSPLAQFIPT